MVDVESGEMDESLAKDSLLNVLSRMRFIAVGCLLQLAAMTIIEGEFYLARIVFRDFRGFLA